MPTGVRKRKRAGVMVSRAKRQRQTVSSDTPKSLKDTPKSLKDTPKSSKDTPKTPTNNSVKSSADGEEHGLAGTAGLRRKETRVVDGKEEHPLEEQSVSATADTDVVSPYVSIQWPAGTASNPDLTRSVDVPCDGLPSKTMCKLLESLLGSWGASGDVVTEVDRAAAREANVRLVYGEVLPKGVRKALADLDVVTASSLVDLGCGKARLAIQAFLENGGLSRVVGVEVCRSRFEEACWALSQLCDLNPSVLSGRRSKSKDRYTLTLHAGGHQQERVLEVRHEDLFACADTFEADIVICETALPPTRIDDFLQLMGRCRKGTRFLLYHSLRSFPGVVLLSPRSGLETVAITQPTSSVRTRSSSATPRSALKPAHAAPPQAHPNKEDGEELCRLTALAPGNTYQTSWNRRTVFDLWLKIT